MTACVNRKHTKKVAAVVTASLVGALSLGVAPVVAMADDGISTQSVMPSVAWSEGKLTYAHDNNGHIIDDLSNMEFEKGSDCKYPKPLEVTPKNGEPVFVGGCTVRYLDADTNAVMDPENLPVGDYVMEISAPAGQYAGGALAVPFKVVNKSLKDLSVFDQSNMDTSDTTFTYTGKPQEIGFILNGEVLAKYDDLFKVTYVYAETSKPVETGKPVKAGNYVARVIGAGMYGGSTVEIPFTIEKLDLSKATVSVADIDDPVRGLPTQATVDGNLLGSGDLKITWAGAENEGSESLLENTTYTVNVTATGNNVTGSAQVSFALVDTLVKTNDLKFKKGGSAREIGGTYYVLTDNALGTTALDADDFYIQGSYPGAKLSVVYTDSEGKVVDLKTVNTVTGDYTVTVRVDAKANGYAYGSDVATMKICNRKDRILSDLDLYFTLDGKVVSDYHNTDLGHITYTGANVADRIGTVLEYNGKALNAGTDYKVTLYKYEGFDGKFFWKQVDNATDCGTYKVVVTSGNYMLEIPGQDYNYMFKVDPKPIQVNLGSDQLKTFDGKDAFIPYTGSAASYYFYYLDGEGNEVRLPEGAVALSHFYFTAPGEKTVDVDEICEIGEYTASIYLGEAGHNYDLTNADYQTNSIKVSDAKVFTDVPTTYWAAENIYNADALGYMNGYNGTTFFGPMDNIKRGDVVVTLFKMAGQPDGWQEDFQTSLGGFDTGFNDVDPGKYYAEAIAWAKAVGITTGDSGTNNFRPEDQISRQELAKMLCVYAEKTGKDVSVDADAVLAKYDDADTVSPWAEEYVAWAVEAGIMGQDSPLRGTDPINRAEVATMAVRLQPKPIEMTEDLIPRPHFGL